MNGFLNKIKFVNPKGELLCWNKNDCDNVVIKEKVTNSRTKDMANISRSRSIVVYCLLSDK